MAKEWGNQGSVKVRRQNEYSRLIKFAAVLLTTVFLFRNYITETLAAHWTQNPTKFEAKCPQVEPLYPSQSTKELVDLEEYLTSDEFRNKSIEKLAGAVRIATQSFDDIGPVGEDPRWDIFYSFADYLSSTFPLVHSSLQLEKVNTHGLLFTWPGTDPNLKPTVLMAHQDVVPVPDSTVEQWTHPPFSGYYDGKFIWGRGSSDCKNQLIAALEAIESLIEAGYIPKRTVILSFGFDEEISGHRGAGHLAEVLVKRYGRHGVAVIVDEGMSVIDNWGQVWAVPGVGEKGYVDVEVTVRMPGGHSSIPPEHNGIGVAGELITLIEANPYDPYLDETNPYLSLLHCGAEHAPSFPNKLKKLLDKRDRQSTCTKKHGKDDLALEAAKLGPAIKYLFTTSVAIDLISGGAKANALPERTQFTVNHRINVGSDSKAVFTHITALAAQVAKKHDLALIPFNGTETPSSITLSVYKILEPAPTTPTFEPRLTPFDVLSGTSRAIYSNELLVAPGIMTGNTDTHYYWNVSEHIFRYGVGWDKEQVGLGDIHTVNERIGVQGHVDGVRWFVQFVRNMDEAEL
ncbi:unnamed protein product [Periconia digitata]|uniref:Peptidase M20 dimerisation domain-containing protein n=1 Tax=Periconia digitata TaxID=1303443 RepID=A0A9W4U9T8_9PLEO|nr:unnamed protein product [Periconia digitata]